MPDEQLAATSTASRIGLSSMDQVDPKPSNRIKKILIKQLDRGYLVRVGCQSFAVESNVVLISTLRKYLKSPDKIEAQWTRGDFTF